MYRIDLYMRVKENKKKLFSSCWYPSEKQAVNARNALMSIPKGVYCQSFGENRPIKKKILGGWICSNPIKDDRFQPDHIDRLVS